MKNNDDLLILGAGASYPYGLPLGSELLTLIKNFENFVKYYFSHSSQFPDEPTAINYVINNYRFNEWNVHNYKMSSPEEKFKCIKDYSVIYLREMIRRGYKEEDFEDFFSRLRKSSVLSIDTFLSNIKIGGKVDVDRYEIVQFIGKSLIGFHICCLYEESKVSDWIESFIHNVIAFRESSYRDNPVNVITFNYDNLFQLKISDYYSNIDFLWRGSGHESLHVYGQINVNMNISRDNIKSLIEEWTGYDGIKTIRNSNDTNGQSDKVSKIRNLVLSSKRIFVLGYGFDSFNNSILFKNKDTLRSLIEDGVEIHCTGFGLHSALFDSLNMIGIHPDLGTFDIDEDIRDRFDEEDLVKIVYDVKCNRLITHYAYPPKLFPEKSEFEDEDE